MTDHRPGCPLRGMPWLAESDAAARAALADLGTREDGTADVWAEVGLSDVLRRVAPSPDDQQLAWCTCRSR